MRIFKIDKDRLKLFEGSYHHHYNQRRLNKAISIDDRISMFGFELKPIYANRGKRLYRRLEQGMRKHHIKMNDYDSIGAEASKHRFGTVVYIHSRKCGQNLEKKFGLKTKTHRRTVPDSVADRALKAFHPDEEDIGGQTVDKVIYRPNGKATVYYEYSPLDEAIDEADEWDADNQTRLLFGQFQLFCIVGAPLSGKHTLQKILSRYGSIRGDSRYNITPVRKNDIDAKSRKWVSCIVTRHQALELKKKYKKRAVILNCVMPYNHWWVIAHRLMKHGKSFNEAKNIIKRYNDADKKSRVDKDYDSVNNVGYPIYTNNPKQEDWSIRVSFRDIQ